MPQSSTINIVNHISSAAKLDNIPLKFHKCFQYNKYCLYCI